MSQDLKFTRQEYNLLHEGLKLLQGKAIEQLQKAKSLGINSNEILEKRVIIEGMLHYVEENYIKRNLPFVQIHGVSPIHLSMLKAAGLEILKQLKEQKKANSQIGIKRAIDVKINEINTTLKFSIFNNVKADEFFLETDANIKSIVFISYDGDEQALADFIRNILLKWAGDKIEPFVSRRDLKAADDPLRVMFDKLLNAKGVVPICSLKSKNSSWVWWESAAVWAKGNKIYPLFTNISPALFGAPLILVSQGKLYFDIDEFTETLNKICFDSNVDGLPMFLTKDEIIELDKLKAEYSKPETSAKIEAEYTKLHITSDLHKYSFILDIENKTQRKFDDVIVELLFPIDYLERKEFNYAHLRSNVSDNNPGYLNIIFTYSALGEQSKSQFGSGLLPGKKLRIFGEKGITNLIYEMDHSRWDSRFKYTVQWKVYINGGAPLEGSVPLNEIQFF